jgi:uncharacterized tellurite resistance protein B-like protein
MAGFLDRFREKVISSAGQDAPQALSGKEIDDKIALGVLLWVVAEADEKFLPEEEDQIKDILKTYSHIPEEEMGLVLSSVKQAAKERIDLYLFTSELKENLDYSVKIALIENLFRVACADHDLDNNELETIRKISGLFGVSHSDFIEAKIKVKKEVGLDTAGL